MNVSLPDELPVVHAQPRAAAGRDVDDAVVNVRDEAGVQTALDFIDSVEAAIAHLCLLPLSGSLRFAFELDIPDLRSWNLLRFPYLVFYVPEDDCIDIWRVLRSRRDTPAVIAGDLERPGS